MTANEQQIPVQERTQTKMFSLCEEKEGDDGIREFRILALSEDKEGLQWLMQAKIKKDEYGYINDKGIEDNEPCYFKTNYEDGFVEYYIAERKVLSREDIMELLQSEEYDPTFRGPENLQEVVFSAVTSYATCNGYRDLDARPVVDAMLSDKEFHAYLIREGWASDKVITDGRKLHAIHDIHFYLDDLLDKHPTYFIETGGLPPFSIPDNLREMLIDSVYVVARDYHLPVSNADAMADQILHDPNFQSVCREAYADISHLSEGSDLYKAAAWSCYDYVLDAMLPAREKQQHPSFQDQVNRASLKREGKRSESHTMPSLKAEPANVSNADQPTL